MKILYIVGNRPQFVKLAVLHHHIKRFNEIQETIIHTGQHFSAEMSDVFFDELLIDLPLINLEVNSLSHLSMLGKFLELLEPAILKVKPDVIVVFGDTNTTLAGAIAGKKLMIPVAHVESGIRTFEEHMPEESNRYLTDRVSSLNFCCTQSGVENMYKEGFDTGTIKSRVVMSGDIMLDAYRHFYPQFSGRKTFSNYLQTGHDEYIVATVHRRQNIENLETLREIIAALNEIHKVIPIVMPVHPNTKNRLEKNNIQVAFTTTLPLGYLDMQSLVHDSKYVITDSGGLQREAFFAQKPVLILMEKPFWPEVMDAGNALCTISKMDHILESFQRLKMLEKTNKISVFGNGNAAEIITEELLHHFSSSLKSNTDLHG